MVVTLRSREGASQFSLPTFPGLLLVLGGHRKTFYGREASLCAVRVAQDVNKEDTDGTLKMVNKESRGKQCCHPGKQKSRDTWKKGDRMDPRHAIC